MRKVLLYILLLSCLPVCLSAQVAYMEEKAKVNKIKRSSLYLYGEGIAATVEEATAMAETSLKNAILSEMGENEKLQDSDQILINSIKKHSEKIQLKRGAMERVFLYVEKKNLLSSDKVVVLDVSSSTVPSQEKPATEEAKVDDSAPSGTSSSEVFTPVSEQGCENKALLQELRPWLVEFGKLGTRGKHTIELGQIFRSGKSDADFWSKYIHNLMSKEDRKNYEAHKSGTLKLQPFYENAMDDMSHEFLKKLLGSTPKDYKGIGSFGNSGTILTKLMLDNDTTTFYTSGIGQKDGDWIGVDLRDVRDVTEVSILQGRNSVDDVDYFDHAILECSADGKTWTPLIGELTKQYVINWKGDAIKARYVRLKRLDSERKNYASVRSFDVNPLHAENLGFKLEAENPQQAVYAFDQNLATSYQVAQSISFEVPQGVKAYTLLMNELSSPLKIKQFDKKGNLLSETTVSSPYFKLELTNDKVTKVSLEGKAEIFEVIADSQQ